MRLFLTKKIKRHIQSHKLFKKKINPSFINHTLSTVRPCPIWTTNTVIPIYTEAISCQSINSEGKLKGQISPKGKGNNREGGGWFPLHTLKNVQFTLSHYIQNFHKIYSVTVTVIIALHLISTSTFYKTLQEIVIVQIQSYKC